MEVRSQVYVLAALTPPPLHPALESAEKIGRRRGFALGLTKTRLRGRITVPSGNRTQIMQP